MMPPPALGTCVRILTGVFRDFIGSIVWADEVSGRLRVQIMLYGRETTAEYHLSEVENT